MRYLNRILGAIKGIQTKEGLMTLAIAMGTIAAVNRVPQLRRIVKGE